MGNIILFLRVSTLGQKLESQEDSLRQAAIADGYNEADCIVIGKKESGIKLNEEEREGLNELKETINTKEIDSIYISELSRLSRRPHILYSLRELLLEKKIQLKCLNPPFILLTDDRSKYDPSANLIFSLFGALAEQEMLEKKERFARGKRRKADEGKYNGGAIPFGYRVDSERDNLIVKDDENSKIVKEIFDKYEAGYSQPKLAKIMSETGRGHITLSMINNILSNASYCGIKKKSKNASYERAYPAIITKEQYNRCRQRANENNSTLSKAKNVYYAEHLIKCPTCGAYWSASGSKASYHCTNAYKAMSVWKYDNHTKEKCTNKTSCSINIIDSILWHVAIEKEALYYEQATEDNIREHEREAERIKAILQNIKPRMENLDRKMDRLREMYIDGLSQMSYDKKKSEINAQKADILSDQIKYKDELNRLLNNIEHLKKIRRCDPISLSDVEDFINGKTDLVESDYPIIHWKVTNRIAQITDDKLRHEIIHRQIKDVEIEPTTIRYPFKVGEKDVKCKMIIVHSFIPSHGEKEIGRTEGVEVYCAIPNGGAGPLILELFPDQIDNDTPKFYDYDSQRFYPFNPYSVDYLDRFVDAPKKKRRLHNAEKIRQAINGKLSINDLQKKYNIKYNAIYYKIQKGHLQGTMINGKYYFDMDEVERVFGKKL